MCVFEISSRMLVKLKIVILLAQLCLLCTGECGKVWLQYSYNPKLEGFIKLHTEPADWHSARVKCHMEGAFLASPWSAEFASVIMKLQTDRPQSAVLYSGVHKTFAEGALTHVKGKLVMSAHPSELMKLERCGVFLAGGSTGEVECDEPLPFVCYRPASDPELDIYTESETLKPENSTPMEYSPDTTSESKSSTPPTQIFTETTPNLDYLSSTTEHVSTKVVPTIETVPFMLRRPRCQDDSFGYEYSWETFGCYKFHAQAVKTWYNAKFACEEEGAHLAVINSDVEAQVLKKLFEKYPAEKMHGRLYTDLAAIGILKNKHVWKTIRGETLGQAGYDSWIPNEPSQWAKFGYFSRDGLFTSFIGIEDTPFICEK